MRPDARQGCAPGGVHQFKAWAQPAGDASNGADCQAVGRVGKETGARKWRAGGCTCLAAQPAKWWTPGRIAAARRYDPAMLNQLAPFLVHWAITALSLWIASYLFRGLRFDGTGALVVSALLLGLANAVVKPLLIVLTLPLTLLTFGLFLLVINALMILLVSAIVRGFRVSGFWTAFFASIFISLLSIAIGSLLGGSDPATTIRMPQGGNWL